MKAKRLCIIDDDRIVQFLTEKNIHSFNAKVDFQSFDDGKKAIDFFRKNMERKTVLPEIVLLDINMPYLDGWGFLKEYKEIKPEIEKTIVIYIMSSSSNPKDIERANDINEVSGYILKPATPQELQVILDEYPPAPLKDQPTPNAL